MNHNESILGKVMKINDNFRVESHLYRGRVFHSEDIGMLDVSTSMLANQASNFLASGEVPERLGNQHPNIVPYQVRCPENKKRLGTRWKTWRCGNLSILLKSKDV